MKNPYCGINRIIAGVIAGLLLFLVLPCGGNKTYAAAKDEIKTVRVAADDSGLFYTLNSDGKPVAGYAYEYIETIAAYSGWQVEYVLCSNFGDCYQMLLDGDIDLFYDVSYTPERAEDILFPNLPMGTEEYYLYCMPGNSDIHAMDYLSYNGKRVGVTSGTVQIDALKEWADNNNIEFEYVEYEAIADKEAALEAGDIDFDLELSMLVGRAYSALDRISAGEYYLVANKNRADLLKDINEACSKISSIDRNYLDRLDEKYYSKSLVSRTLTENEASWVAEHDTLTVGYLNDYLPFCDTGMTGKATGIVKDLIPLMFENIGITDNMQFSYIGYDNCDDMYKALGDGTVDCIFPVCGNMNYAQEKNSIFTSDVMVSSVDMIFNGAYSDNTTSVLAVNKNNQLQAFYSQYYYPNAKILYCNSSEECIEAVYSDRAKATILNGMRTGSLLKKRKYSEINTVRLPENAELCFAVKEGDSAILSLLNRAIANTDDSVAITLSFTYISDSDTNSIEFFRNHPEYLVLILLLVFLLIMAFVFYKKGQDKKQAEKIRREQIAKMAGGVSLYVVNPRNDSFTVLNQTEEVSKKYPSGKSAGETLREYIDNDVYEPDRKMAHVKINVAAMEAYLEKDEEYVVRFRDASHEYPRWYEFKAVKLSDSEILCGFSNKDHEICEQLLFDKMRDNYFGLLYINFETGMAQVLRSENNNIVGNYGDMIPYSSLMKRMADATEGEEADVYNRISDIEYLKSYFKTDDIGYTTYKSYIAKGERWINLTGFVLARNENNNPSILGLAFSSLDDEASEKEEAKRRLSESMAVVGGLAEEYTALYHVNLDTGKYVPYQVNGRIGEIMELFDKYPKFVDLVQHFASSDYARPEDCENLKNLYPSDEAVKEALAHKKVISSILKCKYDGEYLWTEMVIIKCEEENEEAHTVLIGFVEKNQEIQTETERIREAQEAERLIDNIASKYNLAYVVNMADDSFRMLKVDDNIIGKDEQFDNFSQAKEFFINGPLHPVDRIKLSRELSYDVIRRNLEKKKSYDVEYRAIIEDASIWHQMNITSIDKDEIAIGFGIRDIELIKSHLSEKRYDELFALFEVDIDTERIRIVKNEEFVKANIDGKSAPYTEFVTRFANGLDEEPRAFFLQMADLENVKRELEVEDKVSYSYKFSNISGDNWVEVTNYVILRHADNTPAVFTIGFSLVDAFAKYRQEVSERLKEAYEQVNEANMRNDLIYSISNAAKWTYYFDSKDRVTNAEYDDYANGNMSLPAVEEGPMMWLELLHPDDKEKVEKEFWAAIFDHSGKTPYDVTFRMMGRNGEYRWLKSSGRVIRHEDESGELFGMSVNITEEIDKEREQQKILEEARKAAENANRSKTSFLFNMSHDVRTPMNAITGFTNMAKKHIDNKEKVLDYLGKIDTSGQQLLTLINQVLEMARIESGKIELEENSINVRDEFESAVTVLAENAKENGLEFHHSFNDIVHTRVFADKARMSSITFNIAGNAMKYTPKGGRIDFSLSEIPPRKEGYATFIFSVADTGIGMSKEYIKVLFDPFTREKNSTVSKIQGTGLGMSIVKDIVDLIGGNIDVQSEIGKGTRFDITMDLRIDESYINHEMLEESVSKETIKGKRILLVEDNALNREIAIDILDEEGSIVEEAEDGTVAVEMLKEKGAHYYDVILMDVQMPIMNGYEATRAIREMYPDAHIPIIALSANAFSEDKEASLKAGMDDHVAKPIKNEELFDALSRVL